MSTTTLTSREYPLMYSSISSLTSAHNQPPSVPRTYKQASQLFLTRRIPEALELLEPIITPPSYSLETESDADSPAIAPIASATKNARCKVWGLYVSILNEVVELGAEDGKQAFGAARWRELVGKTRNGSVWEEVVKHGYAGSEGSVDVEVVALLATLLLAHAPSQRLTQQRLETYLSLTGQPNLDVAAHMAQSQQQKRVHTFRASGTSTPRDLNQRLKILEIYTLYVLPRNQEWEYARQFIQFSEVLDDDRKEAFLQALQALQEEPKLEAQREEALQKQRQEQLESAKRREEDDARRRGEVEASRQSAGTVPSPKNSSPAKSTTPPEPATSVPTGKPRTPSAKPTPPNQPSKKPKAPPTSLYKRAAVIIFSLRQSVLRMGDGIWKNPVILFRFVLFLFALVLALARRDVRERLEKALKTSWDKVRRTVGMGVKVSYI